jgi:hypothetical protein
MKKSILFILSILLSGMASMAQRTVFDNNCSGVPTGWSMTGTQQAVDYLLDDNAEYVQSPSYDLASFYDLKLTSRLTSDGSSTVDCDVEYSTDGGTNWTTHTVSGITSTITNYSWDIGTINSTTVTFRWKRSSGTDGLQVRNLRLTGIYKKESAATGNWTTAATWSDGTVPVSGDEIYIKNGHNVTVNSNIAETVYFIYVNDGATLTLSSGAALTSSAGVIVYGTFNMSGGTLDINTTSIFKNLTIEGGTFNFSGGTINVGGRLVHKRDDDSNQATTSLSGTAVLKLSLAGVQRWSSRVTGGTFSVASGSSAQIIINNGITDTLNDVSLKYNPNTSSFNGGSLIFEPPSTGSRQILESRKDIYKVESQVGSGNVVHIDSVSTINLTDLTITSGTMVIDSGARITVAATSLGADNNLTIDSDASVIFTAASAPTQKISVKREIAARSDADHGWHFLSSPVSGQAIQTEFVANPPATNDDFYKWDEVTGYWINTKADDGSWNSSFESNFVVGRGYLISYSSDVTKTFSGTVRVTDLAISGLTKTTGNTYEGWNFIGNPYTSALTWDINNWTNSNIGGTAKIWNESNASYTDLAAGSGIIPALQGFMVYVTNTSGGSLTIDEDDRVHSTTSWYKNDSTLSNTLRLTVYDPEGKTSQESIVRIVNEATTGFDPKFDAQFLAGYAPQFYSTLDDGTALSTNALPQITASTQIPFSFIKNTSAAFYLKAEGINTLQPPETVYLTDTKTNHTQILNDDPVYYFSAGANDFPERFILHFAPLGINEVQHSVKPLIYFSNGNIKIKTHQPTESMIFVYDLSGQIIGSARMNGDTETTVNLNGFRGIVVVSFTGSGEIFNQKVIAW